MRDWSFLSRSLRLWPWWFAPVFISGTVSLTLGFWMGSKIAYADWFENQWLYFSKTCALTAVTLMGWLLLLTTRALWIERLCRGLDKVYTLHRYIGKVVFVLLCLHPFFLSLSRLSNWKEWISFFFLPYPFPENSYQLGADFGALCFIILIVLIFLAFHLLNPYRRWLFWHRGMGVFYLLSLVHISLIEKDIANYPFLFAWIWCWLSLGVVCWIWTALYRWVGPRARYAVDHIESDGRVILLKIKALSRKLIFKPGQWVFLEVPCLGREKHPFSIASLPDEDGHLVFGIRVVGPWTQQLQDIKKREKVIVYGPYGMLSDAFLNSTRDCVCIGAGVGITPFIGMWGLALHSPDRIDGHGNSDVIYDSWNDLIKKWKSPKLELFYLVNSEKEAVFDSMIKRYAIETQFANQKKPYERGHFYHLIISNQSQYISLFDVNERVGDLTRKNILLCGPVAMIKVFKFQAKQLGVPPDQIFFEAFDWRQAPIH